IGYAGASEKAREDVYILAKEIRDQKLPIKPNCAARTHIADIQPIVDVSQSLGYPIEASVFIGSSPIRQYVEGWGIDFLLRSTEEAILFARKNGLPVMFVTEDTTRARPDVLEQVYTRAIELGAERICLADTVGHSTPEGARNLVRFIRNVVKKTGKQVKIDWHGHKDRGLSIINSLVAFEAGAHRLHGCALGIGERVGNTPMDLLIVNLVLLGYWKGNVSALPGYVELVSQATGVPISPSYPVFGEDAFRTGTGVHAAAVIKALKKGHHFLADRVYSAIPASLFGRRQKVEVGPMSGENNVRFWLISHSYPDSPDVVSALFQFAKESSTLLSDEQIVEFLEKKGIYPTEILEEKRTLV
ncbi:MAG: LeuA family protein, partial [bacterium]